MHDDSRLHSARPGVIYLAACVSLATGLCCGAAPLLTVPRVREAPRIDGVLNDPAWTESSVAAGFTRLGEAAPAQEPTTFRAVYDGKRLYLAVVCAESALIPAEQRAEQMRITKRARDGNVFADDVIEVFIAPRGDRPYVHLAVSAAGSIYDARNRDARWNLDWQAAVRLGNGQWTVEIAVPLERILGRLPRAWEKIGFNVAREEKPRSELSSWAPLDRGFHEPERFGALVFAGGPAPVVSLGNPSETATEWSVPVRVRASTAGQVRFEAATGKTVLGSVTLDVAAGKTATGRLTAHPGAAQNLTVEARAAGRVVFRSPPVPLAAAGAVTYVAEFAITRGRLTLFLDGRAMPRSGNGKRLRTTLRLDRGVHLIVLACEGPGKVSGQLRSGDFVLRLGRYWRAVNRSGPAPSDPMKAASWPPTRGLAVSEAGAMFARAVAVGGPSKTPLTPQCSLAEFPQGTPELMYPTLDPPALDLPGFYEAVVDMPIGFTFLGADGRAGQQFDDILINRQSNGIQVRLRTAVLGHSGFEISSRFSDASNTTTAYVPTVFFGGTHDWAERKGQVRVPGGSVGLRPLFIKWQKRGAVGECWIDDVEVRIAGSGRVLFRRTFEEPDWRNKPHVVETAGGGHAARIIGLENNVRRQQALWLADDPIPVEPGMLLEIRCRAKCRGVRNKGVPIRAALVCRSDAAPGSEGRGRIWYRAANGFLVQHPRTFAVRTLPPLLGIRPRKIRIVPCYYSDRFDDVASKALAENIDKAGITGIYGSRNHRVARYVRHRLHWILSLPWHNYAVKPLGYTPDTFPEACRQVDFKGKRHADRACPTWLLSAEGRARFSHIGSWIAQRIRTDGGYDEVDWDYETPVVDPPTFCFCPRCIAAFARTIGVDPAELDAKTIVSRYRDQWTTFRCRQNAEIAGLLAEQVHRAAPGVEFSVYSGHQNRRTREHYGVDWSMMAEYVDLGIAGYNAPPAQARTTAAALAAAGKPFMGGEMYFLSLSSPRGTWHPEGWKVRLVRQTIESGGLGCLIWWLPVMDGGAFYQTSRAVGLLAAVEDFVTEGKRADRSVRVLRGPADDVVVLQLGSRRCVLLFNPTPRPRTFETDPGGRFVEILETGKTGRPLPRLVTVPANDVRAFVEAAVRSNGKGAAP